MEEMRKQVAIATKQLRSSEMQRQLHVTESLEFKRQMRDMQRKMNGEKRGK